MAYYLSAGYKLNNHDLSGEYIIKKVIGRGASTIAYLADFKDVSGRVSERILKEYYPSNLNILRDSNGVLLCTAKDLQKYQDGIKRFVAGGDRQNMLRERTYLKNETPPLQKIFEANNTCYLEVTPFEGKTFDNIESFTLLERIKLCLTTSKLIKRYHEEGLLYLDIKPQNIFVLTNSSGDIVTDMIELIDFDSVVEKNAIVFGNSLSFTEAWAAPEQINPHSFGKISEATDIYAIGELVFWCVFNRHSFTSEHRGFSLYSFNNLTNGNETLTVSKTAEMILTNLFHRTLRSSTQNRFSKMEEVIALLDKLVEELGKKEIICKAAIRQTDFFVGRETELEDIKKSLQNHSLVFVSGIMGIGKSEIIKQYAYVNQNSYSNILYWQYDGSLISMICNEEAVIIDNFTRYPKEDDKEYCFRKLKKLVSLSDDNTLIIIDNVDILVEELESKEIWHLIKGIPGKILVGTRCDEQHYCQVKIEEIKDIELLKEMFFEQCYFAETQANYVENIIGLSNFHTYEIKLLAAYTKAKRQLPEDTLGEMKQFGFSSFGNTSLSVLKDGDSPEATFADHIIKLLTMSQLSENQQIVLLKLAFLPVSGINVKEIKSFYSWQDINDLNWLINHGFVSITSDDTHVVSVHPSVSNIVISIAKNESDLLMEFYKEALIAMRKGYDDVSINQDFYKRVCEYINDPKFIDTIKAESKKHSEDEIKKTIDDVRCAFAAEYAPSGVSQAEYLSLCNSIVEKTVMHKIEGLNVAHFITQYVEWFAKYGHYTLQKMLIEYALHIYKKENNETYCPDREYAYSVYADLLLLQGKEDEEVVQISLQHLQEAKRVKDWSMASYWCANVARAYFCMCDVNAYKFHFKNVYYGFKGLRSRKVMRNSFDNSFSPNMSKSNIRTAELNESMYDLYPPGDCKLTIFNLRLAISERKKAIASYLFNAPSDNVIRIAIDEARIAILQLHFDDARRKLISAIETYKTGKYQFTLASMDACELLGDVLVIEKHFSIALDAYKEALQIADLLGVTDTVLITVKMGRALNLSMQLELAKEYNNDILSRLKDASHEKMQHIVADAYYNVGDNEFLSCNYAEAAEMFNIALSLYESATSLRLHNNIGKARCNERLARILQERNSIIEGKQLMEKSVSVLEEMLGMEHPEVIEFKSRLQSFEQ